MAVCKLHPSPQCHPSGVTATQDPFEDVQCNALHGSQGRRLVPSLHSAGGVDVLAAHAGKWRLLDRRPQGQGLAQLSKGVCCHGEGLLQWALGTWLPGLPTAKPRSLFPDLGPLPLPSASHCRARTSWGRRGLSLDLGCTPKVRKRRTGSVHLSSTPSVCPWPLLPTTLANKRGSACLLTKSCRDPATSEPQPACLGPVYCQSGDVCIGLELTRPLPA